ncbi:hypothetical protein GEMRC1_000695 [Eukaryota sp. GEM-RC1]
MVMQAKQQRTCQIHYVWLWYNTVVKLRRVLRHCRIVTPHQLGHSYKNSTVVMISGFDSPGPEDLRTHAVMEDDDESDVMGELMEDDEQTSQRAGLSFPVGRVRRYLRKGHYHEHIRVEAAVYLTTVLEYLAAEALELSGNVARDKRKSRITPDHIITAFRNDEELRETLALIRIPVGGVVPHTSSDFFKCVLDEESTAVQSNTFSFSSTAFCNKLHSFQKTIFLPTLSFSMTVFPSIVILL